MESESIDDVIGRLEGMSEELADLAMNELRRAVDAGEGNRPDLERRLTRARRSVDKAAAILRGG